MISREIIRELEILRQQVAEFRGINRQYQQSEQKLREEKALARNYLDIAGAIIVVIDKSGKVILINKKGSEILGHSQEDIVGKDWFANFIPKRNRSQVKDIFSKIISGKEDFSEYNENPVLTKQGEERLISWHNTILRDGQGKVAASLSSGEDITRRRLVEERLRLLNGCFLSFGIDPKKNIDKLIALCAKSLGANYALYNRLEGQDKLYLAGSWNLPENYKASKSRERICRDLTSQKNGKILFIRDSNGSIIGTTIKLGKVILGSLCLVYQRSFAATEADENFIKIVASAIGVEEERRHAYNARQQNLELYRALTKTSPDGVAFIDLDSNFVMVNQQAAKLYGFATKEEIIGKNILDFASGPVKQDIKEALAGLKDTGKVISFEGTFSRKDRSSFIGSVSFSLLKDTAGYPKAFISTLKDITGDRYKAQIIKDSEERYRTFFKQASDSILLIDAENGKFIEFNDLACQTLGYGRKEFSKLTIFDIESLETVQETTKHIVDCNYKCES